MNFLKSEIRLLETLVETISVITQNCISLNRRIKTSKLAVICKKKKDSSRCKYFFFFKKKNKKNKFYLSKMMSAKCVVQQFILMDSPE